jgi:hypothetical protein
MATHSDDSPARAEELIVEIYRQIRAMSAGSQPKRVVLNRTHYDILQAYRARLGELPDERPDYLERYAIFGLELAIDDCEQPRVE